jgi:hypothetical protein
MSFVKDAISVVPTQCLHWEHSVEDIVPNLACIPYIRDQLNAITMRRTGNSEPELKVLVVMSQVVFLHLPHVCRELGVMQPAGDEHAGQNRRGHSHA